MGKVANTSFDFNDDNVDLNSLSKQTLPAIETARSIVGQLAGTVEA
jgi:hypothetical protein